MKVDLVKEIENDIKYNEKICNFIETKDGIGIFFNCYRILVPINIAFLTSTLGLSLSQFLSFWIIVSMGVLGLGELMACYSVFLSALIFSKEEREKYFGNNFLKRFVLGRKNTRINEKEECRQKIKNLEKELENLKNINQLDDKVDNYGDVSIKNVSEKRVASIDRSFEICDKDVKIRRKVYK